MVKCGMLTALGFIKPEFVLTPMLNTCDLGLSPKAEPMFLHLQTGVINTLPPTLITKQYVFVVNDSKNPGYEESMCM